MDDAQLLEILKCDLEMLGTGKDTYLTHLIKVAKLEIEAEGITLENNVRDGHLVVMYAAWLYRKRAATTGEKGTSDGSAMPRMLRWTMNNRLFGQKARETDVT